MPRTCGTGQVGAGHRNFLQCLFLLGLYYMFGNRTKYKNVQEAMTVWKDYMVSMGFGV